MVVECEGEGLNWGKGMEYRIGLVLSFSPDTTPFLKHLQGMLDLAFDKTIIKKRKQLFFLSWLQFGSLSHMKMLFIIFQCDCNFRTTSTKAANYAKH